MIALVLASKRINIFRSGENKFSKKGVRQLHRGTEQARWQ
jgi:hypothetical protein